MTLLTNRFLKVGSVFTGCIVPLAIGCAGGQTFDDGADELKARSEPHLSVDAGGSALRTSSDAAASVVGALPVCEIGDPTERVAVFVRASAAAGEPLRDYAGPGVVDRIEVSQSNGTSTGVFVELGNGQSLEIVNLSPEFPAFEVGQQLEVDLRGPEMLFSGLNLFVTFRDMSGELLLAHYTHDDRFFEDGTLSTPDSLGVALSFADECTVPDPCSEVTTGLSLSVDVGNGEVRTLRASDVEELQIGSSQYLFGFKYGQRSEGTGDTQCADYVGGLRLGFTMVRQ
ncbi:MAG: hypothetical protein RJA70_267 [Pseudomonadota bacterium]|jgi:hypothetical protein